MPKRISTSRFNPCLPVNIYHMESMTGKFYPMPNGLELWYYIQSETLFKPHIKITRGNTKYSSRGRSTNQFLSIYLSPKPRIIFSNLKVLKSEERFLKSFVQDNYKAFQEYLSPSKSCNFDTFYSQLKEFKWPIL